MDDPTNLNATVKGALALCFLAFHAGAIVLVAVDGDPKNSLHTSLLAWSEAGSLAILAGLGFSSVLDYLKK